MEFKDAGVGLHTQSIQFLARLLTRLSISRRDVNFRSISNKAFGYHTPNAFRSAGNEDNFVLWGTLVSTASIYLFE